MHWFTRISIAKRWVTFLIATAIIGGSIFGTLQLKTELMPDIELPFVVVFGSYPGHSPEQVLASRGEHSKPVVDRFFEVLRRRLETEVLLPTNPYTKAARWPA